LEAFGLDVRSVPLVLLQLCRELVVSGAVAALPGELGVGHAGTDFEAIDEAAAAVLSSVHSARARRDKELPRARDATIVTNLGIYAAAREQLQRRASRDLFGVARELGRAVAQLDDNELTANAPSASNLDAEQLRDEMAQALTQFGHDTFRPGQREVARVPAHRGEGY
jgi:hypothetical protein